MAKITKRTGKTTKMGGIVGAVVFGAFALMAFAFPNPGADEWMPDGLGGGMDKAFFAFQIIWVVVCGAGCIYNLYLAFKGEGISEGTIDIEPDAGAAGQPAAADFDERLRKLESLRSDGLLTDDEYRKKRAQILGDKW